MRPALLLSLLLLLLAHCVAGASSAFTAADVAPLDDIVRRYMRPERAESVLARLSSPGEGVSFLEVAAESKTHAKAMAGSGESSTSESSSSSESSAAAAPGQCEVCVYVIENKEQHQPYLCRGLKDPDYQVHALWLVVFACIVSVGWHLTPRAFS